MKIKSLFTCALLGCVFMTTSCSNDDDNIIASSVSSQSSEETFEPVTFTAEDPTHVIMLDGNPVTFTLKTDSLKTRSVSSNIVLNEVGPFPTATPFLVKKGNYKKYFSKLPQFDFLPSYSVVLLRLDEFRFDVNLPKSAALDGACDLTPITEQGFATESANYKGYQLISKISHVDGYKLTFRFYIQSGIAYDLAGRQLCGDVDHPLPGADVRYNYTYYTLN